MPFDRHYQDLIEKFTRELIEAVGQERLEVAIESGEDPIADAVKEMIEKGGDALFEALKRRTPEMVTERRENLQRYNELIFQFWGRAFNLLEATIQVAYETGEDFLASYADRAEDEQDLVFYVLTRLHVRACRIAE